MTQFGALVGLEPRLGKKLLEPLTNLINSTSAMSLLYECINTVIAGSTQHQSHHPSFGNFARSLSVLISVAGTSGGDHTASIQVGTSAYSWHSLYSPWCLGG